MTDLNPNDIIEIILNFYCKKIELFFYVVEDDYMQTRKKIIDILQLKDDDNYEGWPDFADDKCEYCAVIQFHAGSKGSCTDGQIELIDSGYIEPPKCNYLIKD